MNIYLQLLLGFVVALLWSVYVARPLLDVSFRAPVSKWLLRHYGVKRLYEVRDYSWKLRIVCKEPLRLHQKVVVYLVHSGVEFATAFLILGLFFMLLLGHLQIVVAVLVVTSGIQFLLQRPVFSSRSYHKKRISFHVQRLESAVVRPLREREGGFAFYWLEVRSEERALEKAFRRLGARDPVQAVFDNYRDVFSQGEALAERAKEPSATESRAVERRIRQLARDLKALLAQM